MPKVMKICKACGKEYEACHTPNPGVFRWRDVACSLECAQKYIHDVMVARGEIVDQPTEQPAETPAVNEAVIEDQPDGTIDASINTEATDTSAPEKTENPVRHNRFRKR